MTASRSRRRATSARSGRKNKAAAPREDAVPGGNAQRILAAVRSIPRGRVSTYGQVADLAGLPRRARLVGAVLRETNERAPWQRVINASGRISFPLGSDAYARQAALLEAEGVVLSGGRVDLRRYGWPAREQQLDELLWGPK